MTKKGAKEFQKPLEESPTPQPVEVPMPKLIDVMREIKTLRNDVNLFLEQVKALGSDIVKSREELNDVFTDFGAQIQELQRAFINVVSKGFEALATTPKQTTSSDLGNVESLRWSDKPWGQWAFATTREGEVIADASKLVTALKQSEKRKLSADGYDYSLSKDGKFIQRRKRK